jgi:DNA-binding SARP family transcriptional activator
MKVNRATILWAIKKSATISDVTKLLGREPEYEERVWDKMLRFYPDAEDYLKKNESLQEMKEHKAEEDWDALKESRLEYIGATYRLMKNKMI